MKKNINPAVIFIRANEFYAEPRLIKEYNVAKQLGKCMLILWNREVKHENFPDAKYLKLPASRGTLLLLFYLPIWYVFCILTLIKLRPSIIHACDTEGVIPAYIYSKFYKTKIIFDIFDATIAKFPIQKKSLEDLLIKLDKFFMQRVNVVILPDPERLKQLNIMDNQRIKNKCSIIYNSDFNASSKKTVNFKNKKVINISYVGVLSKKIRGLEQIINVASLLSNYIFHIAGYGPDEEYFKNKFNKEKINNLHFYGKISHDKAMELNQKSDIMITLLSPKYNNYLYATSTKAFEAFTFLKPVITTKGTATGNLITKTNWGVAVRYNKQDLIKILNKIATGQITFKLDPKKTQQYGWENMSKDLKSIYEKLYNLQ